ncbi:hypothetical protein CB457P1_00100 [Enterocloster phage CB457P1]|nr:hypothetical protein CB457P1_00100 [Enterocloster phage CB457P1]
MGVVLRDREDGRLRDGERKGIGDCGENVGIGWMEIRESIGYVSERMEKMEWEDMGK